MTAWRKKRKKYRYSKISDNLTGSTMDSLREKERPNIMTVVLVVLFLIAAILSAFLGLDESTGEFTFKIGNVTVLRGCFSLAFIVGAVIIAVLSNWFVVLPTKGSKTGDDKPAQ